MVDWNSIYQKIMKLGKATGCHQSPERSFFFHGRQFPFCARCTGVFLGELAGIFTFKVGEITGPLICVFLGFMMADWGIQYITKHESTNQRRLITGMLCGYAFANMLMKFIRWGTNTFT